MKKTVKSRFKKSIVFIVLCSLLLSCYPIAVSAASFTDIDGHWAEEYIEDVVSRGIMSGTSDTTFSPSADITRAQFLLSLSKCLGIILDNSVSTGFTDVPANKYYTGAVKWAVDNDILSPISSTTFSPSTPLTREMAANALARYFIEYNVVVEINDEYEDLPIDCTNLSASSKNNVKIAIALELMSTDTNGNFNPSDTVSRGQVAVIFSNLSAFYLDPLPWRVFHLFGQPYLNWLYMFDNEKVYLRWCNYNLDSYIYPSTSTRGYYARYYLETGMNFYNESGRAIAVEWGSSETANIRFIVPTREVWNNELYGSASTIAICVPINTDDAMLTPETYKHISNRNIKRMDIYFNPDLTSTYDYGQEFNINRIIAHEVFHGLGFDHIDPDIAISIMNTHESLFDMDIDHLQQYDYIALISKYCNN